MTVHIQKSMIGTAPAKMPKEAVIDENEELMWLKAVVQGCYPGAKPARCMQEKDKRGKRL